MILPLALVLLAAPQDLDPATMRADLEALEAQVRARWSYLELRASQGLDLDETFARARARTGEPLGRDGFALVLRELVAELRDGHGGVRVPGEELPPRRLPLRLCDTAEGIAVERVASELEVVSGGPPPRPGERVHALGGRPVGEAHAEAVRRVCASTPGMARRSAFARLREVHAEEVELELEDAAGARRKIVLRTFPGSAPGLDAAPDPEEGWALSFPREDVALLRVTSFSPPDWRAWGEAGPEERDGLLQETYRTIEDRFERLAASGARALVLDLRGNGGGTDLLGIHLAKHLLPERFVYFRLSSLVERGWTSPHGYEHAADEGMHVFRGPLVALIDEACFSVTDDFLRCIDDQHPDLVTVGRPSGGGAGAPRGLEPLPGSGAVVTLCTMRVYGPAGAPIEGLGTVPDVPAARTRADLAAGRDAELEAALQLLEARLRRGDGAPGEQR